MTHCCWLTQQQQCKSREVKRKRHCPLSGRATTDSAPTFVGLRVLAPRSSRERTVPDPSMVNLRMTGLCHSPGKSIQLTQGKCGWSWTSLGFVSFSVDTNASSRKDISPSKTD